MYTTGDCSLILAFHQNASRVCFVSRRLIVHVHLSDERLLTLTSGPSFRLGRINWGNCSVWLSWPAKFPKVLPLSSHVGLSLTHTDSHSLFPLAPLPLHKVHGPPAIAPQSPHLAPVALFAPLLPPQSATLGNAASASTSDHHPARTGVERNSPIAHTRPPSTSSIVVCVIL
ncbi:hypothetical protein EJ06DRAFT_370041 [Trichodelitschia bisporula]|uniref:Uncharacterized protein n=1 Tax=Trichodelitschia bisporula TaxID=703511 RepID=A0A6G1I1W8_9PEZI|nr:hypothetical protein EJ06DRAFT_370041 [Trichodelitschia bisporula]